MKVIRKVLIGTASLFSVFVVVLFVISLIHNIKLKKDFSSIDKFDYLEALNDGSLEKKIRPYQTNVQAMLGSDTQKNEITVPRDLVYSYDDEQYIIHHGEMINVYYDEKDGFLTYYGYGFLSFPTDKKGVRAAMPFKLTSETEARIELYSIDLQSLKCTYAEYYQENISHLSKIEQWLDLKIRNVKRETALYWPDQLLYREGIYLSKDLYWPLLNPTLVIITGILWLILGVTRYNARRRKNKPLDR